jgi:hypothetical protein
MSYCTHSFRTSSLRSRTAVVPDGFPPIGLVLAFSNEPQSRHSALVYHSLQHSWSFLAFRPFCKHVGESFRRQTVLIDFDL